MEMNYTTNSGEKLSIAGNLETGYYIYFAIHYSKNYKKHVPGCKAGKYKTYLEAHREIKRLRPSAHIQCASEWNVIEI